ncbi:MAG: response regulator [Oligoflexales bacterium]
MKFNTIGSRIGLGHVAVISILAISVILIRSQTDELFQISKYIKDTRAPSASLAASVLTGIADTQTEVRRWIYERKEEYEVTRQSIWQQKIAVATKQLTEVSINWRTSESSQALKDFLSSVQDLKNGQDRLLDMPKDEAIAILDSKLVPLAGKLRNNLEVIIQNQGSGIAADLETQTKLVDEINFLPILLLLVMVAASILIGYVIVKSVGRPIATAIEVAGRIAKGDYSLRVKVTGSEELNRLGGSLEYMRESLETQSWLHQTQIKFHEAVQGVTEVREMANAVTSLLADRVKSSVGVFYVCENQKLKLAGGFSLPSGWASSIDGTFGVGLAGQAALERRKISVSEPSSGSLTISSSVGPIEPKEITAFPLIYRDELLGVIELATMEKSGERDAQLLDIVSQLVAIGLNNIQKGEQVRNLLGETQTQAEELQSQQEELRNSNEELQSRQEELEAINEELEEQKSMLESQKVAIDQRNADLEEAKRALASRAEELDRVSRYKSEFLANMSHELRTPLNSQLILSKLLMENKEQRLSDKQVEYAKTIHSSGIDLLSLINDILDLSKVESGKLALEIQTVSIEDLAASWHRTLLPTAQQKGLGFRYEIDPRLPANFSTDTLRLGQIIKNLLSNAIKFTQSGEVVLKVEKTVENTQTGNELQPKNFIAFRVIDTGIGIPEEKLGTIFDAFVQVDSSTSRKYGGTGLGLAISRGLAVMLGGDIEVRSEPGKGSSFSLVIPEEYEADAAMLSSLKAPRSSPHASSHESARGTESKKTSGRTGTPTVLVVEDDASFATVLSSLIQEKGFKCLIARDGVKGLEYARAHLPACILLDYRLPGMHGLQVLRNLKRDPATKQIPVHMISVDDRSREAMELGAVDYLVKPVEPEKIQQILGRLESLVRKEMKRILVVDDEEIQREEIIRYVASEDATVVGVGTAGEAYQALKKDRSFDCIILDLMLPDMSGIELLNKIHADKGLSCPPVVVYTAQDLSIDQEQALRKYSDSIIVKGPHSLERLLDEVSLFIHKITQESDLKKQTSTVGLYQVEKVFEGKKVLLVDDDIRNIFALSSVLEEQGLKVDVARNGEEALKALFRDPSYHVVLMDIMMPIMDGYEAMRRIRQDNKLKTIPIIALTAKAMKGDKEACLDAGANDYVSKPIDSEQLLNLLRVWLAK